MLVIICLQLLTCVKVINYLNDSAVTLSSGDEFVMINLPQASEGDITCIACVYTSIPLASLSEGVIVRIRMYVFIREEIFWV